MMFRLDTFFRTGGSFLIFWVVGAGALRAQGVELDQVTPSAVQRGAVADFRFLGENLGNVEEIVFGPNINGVTVTDLNSVDNETVSARLTVDADTPVGWVPLWIRTEAGFSNPRTLRITPFPTQTESEPNEPESGSQSVTLESSVLGVIDDRDRDAFEVQLEAGERFSAEVTAVGLSADPIDAHLTIVDPDGAMIATSDDNPLLGLDPYVSIVAQRTGSYTIIVRESTYRGSPESRYVLHVGRFLRPSVPYPLGGLAGTDLELALLDRTGTIGKSSISLPPSPSSAFPVFPRRSIDGPVPPSAVLIRVSDKPNLLELEPNNSRPEANDVGPQPLVAINGIIEEDGDLDLFRLQVTPGAELQFDVIARQLHSPIDPYLRAVDSQGKLLGENDDSITGHDSSLRLIGPEEGILFVEVSDHRGRGGADYVYRVEVSEPSPSLQLSVATSSMATAEGRSIAVPQGNRSLVLVGAQRVGVEGPVTLGITDLPEGVRLIGSPTMTDGVPFTPLVLEAIPDARLSSGFARVQGDCNGVAGRFGLRVPLTVGPGGIIDHEIKLERLPVAVVEEALVSIGEVKLLAPLVADGGTELVVNLEIDRFFDGTLRLRVPFLPPWVTSPGEIEVEEGETRVTIPLESSSEARGGPWPIVVEAVAELEDNQTVRVASKPLPLTIEPPAFAITLAEVAAPLGGQAELPCTITPMAPSSFTSKVTGSSEITVELAGLPSGVRSEPVTVLPDLLKDTVRVKLPVTVEPGAVRGLSEGIYAKLSIPTGASDEHRQWHYGGRGSRLQIIDTVDASETSDSRPQSKLDALRSRRRPGDDTEQNPLQ